jgi:hypothetical protein
MRGMLQSMPQECSRIASLGFARFHCLLLFSTIG